MTKILDVRSPHITVYHPKVKCFREVILKSVCKYKSMAHPEICMYSDYMSATIIFVGVYLFNFLEN